jgi:hypothetical protein
MDDKPMTELEWFEFLCSIFGTRPDRDSIALDPSRLELVFDGMPEKNKRAVLLRFSAGRTFKAISSELGYRSVTRGQQLVEQGLRMLSHPSRKRAMRSGIVAYWNFRTSRDG